MRRPRQRGTTTQRGYGTAHAAARRRWLELLRDRGSLPCTRCGQPVYVGQDCHLDHTEDRTGYLGLAHARCNRLAGASKGGRIVAERKKPPPRGRTSRDWF